MSENEDKSKHGISFQKSVENILKDMLEHKYIRNYIYDYYVAMPGYIDEQFYVAFLVEFNNSEKWALYTTTKMRDRFKGQLWDAHYVKKIDSSVKKAYLIYPDGLAKGDENAFLSKKNAILNRTGYYPNTIDDILSQSEFANLIEDTALSDVSSASRRGILGNRFEDRVARIMAYSNNLRKWKTGDGNIEGLHYDLFEKIVKCFDLDKDKVYRISASSNQSLIGTLPNGGKPKTDVVVMVQPSESSNRGSLYTISCKRTSANEVSVHDYTAAQFADVLDPTNRELKSLLIDFQAAGSMRDYGEEKCERLTRELAPYLNKLNMWVLGGFGGEQRNAAQTADYILTYNDAENVAAIHRIESYIDILNREGHVRNFGTLFGWTYPSGQRGKRIQLKCRIIEEEE